jgi:hypothetical protein
MYSCTALSINSERLPVFPTIRSRCSSSAVESVIDVLLFHNPVPGCAADEDIEKIATREKLDDIKHSWFESEKLTDNELIDSVPVGQQA